MRMQHDEALNRHRLEGLLALYAPSPKTVIFGSGLGKKLQGKAEIKTADKEATPILTNLTQ
jgi:hypothetical protein